MAVKVELHQVNATVELEVYILFLRSSGFLGRWFRGSRFELSQFRGHNSFHPTY